MFSIIDSELGDFYLVIHILLCQAILADFKGEIFSTEYERKTLIVHEIKKNTCVYYT